MFTKSISYLFTILGCCQTELISEFGTLADYLNPPPPPTPPPPEPDKEVFLQ